MRIMTTARLKEYEEKQVGARLWLRMFKTKVQAANWTSIIDVKKDYPQTDFVTTSVTKDTRVVFDVCGNKFRLIAHINFEFSTLYLKALLTHAEYSKIDLKKHIF